MRKNLLIYTISVGIISLSVCIGTALADTHSITTTLGGSSGDTFDLTGTMQLDSIKIGRQGTGGVTFFNGTIVNNTTGTGGTGNPVTFGDDVRIDGRVYRGAEAGTSDSLPFIVNDNMEVAGALTIGSLSSSSVINTANLADSAVTSAKIADATIASGDLADSAVTNAKIASGAVTQGVEGSISSSVTTTQTGNNYDIATQVQMTTGASSLFCTFTGYGTIDTPNTTMRVALLYDGETLLRTLREATVGHDNVGHVVLATSFITSATAGTHTVQVGWNTAAGTTATIFYGTLDCLEFKK